MAERLFVRLPDDHAPGPETDAPPGSFVSCGVPSTLAPLVTSVLAYREDLGEGEVLERVVPEGVVRLAFNLGIAPTAGSGEGERVEAIGASTEPALVRLRGHMDGITVTLRPGAAEALLGVPAAALRDRAVDLDALWGGEASQWLEHLRALPDAPARLHWLSQALLRRARHHARFEAVDAACAARAAALIGEAGGRIGVRAVADAMGLGERRLQQLFQRHVGLSPRSYARVARMHALLRALRSDRPPAWARLARATGFYDQAHLANEFRALAGLSPTAFVTHVAGSSKTVG